MFKKFSFAFLLAMFLSQFVISTAFAADEPAGGCAPGFTLEMAMDHDDHHHRHVGTDSDKNGDGYICMKPATPSGKIHVHVDNNVP
jgi:hypothetical protein